MNKVLVREHDVRTRFIEYRSRIAAIIALLGNQPVRTTDDEVAKLLDMTPSQLRTARHLMIHIGALDWTASHSTEPPTWRVKRFGPDLERAIDLEMERQMRGGRSVEGIISVTSRAKRTRVTRGKAAERVGVSTDRLGFETGAVTGPDAPNKLEALASVGPQAPAALVMAAKQYRKRGDDPAIKRAQELMKELQDIGVPVPPALAAKAQTLTDSRLEVIGLVLPYIEELERKVVAAGDAVRAQGKVAELENTVRRQRQQIERLVSERTATALGDRPART